MKGARRWVRARRVVKGVGNSEVDASAQNGQTPVDRLVASGVFDRAYYEIQTGTSFPSVEAAARDFLQQGHRLGMSPHPLFEPEWFRGERPRNRPNTLLAYLDEGGGENGPGPLFGESVYLELVPEAAAHPGGALGHFVTHAGTDDPLPAPAGHRASSLTWGQARELAYESAREFRRFEDLRSAPRRRPWDEVADRRFVADWLARERPRDPAGTPLVSVVMPVRNRPVQVLEAIESVQHQTIPDWELIVVDDGSTDDTADVVERAGQADARVRLVRQSSGGVSAARNAGIAAASGEWLAFLDSDNTWVPHFLQVMVGYLESAGLRAGHAVIDTQVEPTEEGSGRYLAFDGTVDHLLVRNHIDLNGLMVKTRIGIEAGRFDESLRRWVDHDFAIRVARITPIRLVPFVGVRYDHREAALDRITTTESSHWQWAALAKNYVDWAAVERGEHERTPGRVSICVTTQDWRSAMSAVSSTLDAARQDAGADRPGGDVEVVVVNNGSRRSVAAILQAVFAMESQVRLLSIPRNMNFGIGSNVAFAATTGDTAVFLTSHAEVRPGWLSPLLESLDKADVIGCQPLVLFPDGTVRSAGLAFPGGDSLPSPLLEHHPVDDAVRAAPIQLHAVSGAALAMRAGEVIRLRGFDPMLVNGCEDVDLCLRAIDGGSRRFEVVTRSTVIHHGNGGSDPVPSTRESRRIWYDRWAGRVPSSELAIVERIGLQIAHMSAGDITDEPGDVRIPTPILVRPAFLTGGLHRDQPFLRWALKTSVPLRAADSAPDLVRAVALATALRQLGQDVVVDRLESDQRASRYLDDVSVALLRDVPLLVDPGRVNIAWLLGDPADLTLDQARCYDAILAATPAGPVIRSGLQWATTSSDVVSDGGPGTHQEEVGTLARMLLSEATQAWRSLAWRASRDL